MGFWSRTEDFLLALQADRARLARYLQIGYWISFAVVILGFALIVLSLFTGWHV